MKIPEFTVKKCDAEALIKYLVYYEDDIPPLPYDPEEETEPNNNFIHQTTFVITLFFGALLCLPLFFYGYVSYLAGVSVFFVVYFLFKKWLTYKIFWTLMNLVGKQYKNFQELRCSFFETSFFYNKITDQFRIDYSDIEKVNSFEGNLFLHTKGERVGIFVIPKREINNFKKEISKLLDSANDNKGLKIVEV